MELRAPDDNFFGEAARFFNESKVRESIFTESGLTAGLVTVERKGRRPLGFWALDNTHKSVSINIILHFRNKKRDVYIFLPNVFINV